MYGPPSSELPQLANSGSHGFQASGWGGGGLHIRLLTHMERQIMKPVHALTCGDAAGS